MPGHVERYSPGYLSDSTDALLDEWSHTVSVWFDEAIAKQAAASDGPAEIVAERDFVVPTGGSHFFSPSISGLREIQGGPKHSTGSPSGTYPL
jgi:hypothetical protein